MHKSHCCGLDPITQGASRAASQSKTLSEMPLEMRLSASEEVRLKCRASGTSECTAVHYQRGLSLQKTLREETLGATILVTAVTELPLQLPLVQKNTGTQHWRKEYYQSLASRV